MLTLPHLTSHTLRRTLMSLPLLSLMGGCIIYDHENKCPGCEDSSFTDTDGPNHTIDDTGDTSDTGDTGDTAPITAAFLLTPAEGEAGHTAIVSLTATGFDLSTVANVRFYGTVNLIASENRGDEVLMTVEIPAGASPTTVDMLLELNDNSAKLVEDALTILEDSGTGGDTGAPCE